MSLRLIEVSHMESVHWWRGVIARTAVLEQSGGSLTAFSIVRCSEIMGS